MRRQNRLATVGIVLLTAIAVLIDFPTMQYDFTAFGREFKGTLRGPDINLPLLGGGRIERELKIHQGLDLQGGLQLTYQADMAGIPEEERPDKIQEVVHKIERRINQLGVTEPITRTSVVEGNYRAVVEIPGVGDVEAAKSLIGTTAQLDFREYVPQFELPDLEDEDMENLDEIEPVVQASYEPVGLTGNDFQRASATVDMNPESRTYNQPIVEFEFKREAATVFSDLTQRLSQEGGILAIFLDDEVIFEGTTAHITDGRGIITGQSGAEEAKELAIALNEGALPVPISVVSEKLVSPTLGQESVNKSLIAGLIGIIAISIAMLFLYKLPGAVAVVALTLYSLYVLALFKLIPVTLTLAGVAGFILSLGMAVDANILIFERFKEEIRAGRSLPSAMDIGFRRAWDSIRDSNFSSLIICLILFFFGSGTVRGFAITLALGISVSMFTAIVITQRLMNHLIRLPRFQDLRWYGIGKEQV